MITLFAIDCARITFTAREGIERFALTVAIFFFLLNCLYWSRMLASQLLKGNIFYFYSFFHILHLRMFLCIFSTFKSLGSIRMQFRTFLIRIYCLYFFGGHKINVYDFLPLLFFIWNVQHSDVFQGVFSLPIMKTFNILRTRI